MNNNIIWNIDRFNAILTIKNIRILNFNKNDILPKELENCKKWRLSNETENYGTFTALWEKRKIKDLAIAKKLVETKYNTLISTY